MRIEPPQTFRRFLGQCPGIDIYHRRPYCLGNLGKGVRRDRGSGNLQRSSIRGIGGLLLPVHSMRGVRTNQNRSGNNGKYGKCRKKAAGAQLGNGAPDGWKGWHRVVQPRVFPLPQSSNGDGMIRCDSQMAAAYCVRPFLSIASRRSLRRPGCRGHGRPPLI